ncbi:hypothetical protein GCK72_025418 [Caenorhabditis remanei]|uniref:Uncharacterized protein n=1 Tax=Caenorhabditis remanei TaxID=31234 RepID=A0A6A5G2G3_CAERE|nr:hypothetical protein GCK72_025418 [Caenorhabditis remanei]KAF1748951.1 hypothetical protein GCK72_025418 [Caenorhabditis remanei]
MLATVESFYRTFLDIYCPAFFFGTVAMQGILIYFILFQTGAKMGVFRYILGHTSVCQLILLFITISCQFRMISSKVPVEVRCYGPFRFFPAVYTYAMHQAFQFFLFMSGMSIIVTLYFKLMTFNFTRMTKAAMIITFLLFHIPVAFSGGLEIYLVITVSLPKEIQEMYSLKNIDVSLYSTAGTMKLQTVSFMNFLIMVGSVFVYPFASFWIRHRILKHLNHHLNSFSSHNKAQHRSFVTGLTLQSFLPVLTYFPLFALYVFCVTTGAEIIFQQYFIYLMPTTPALIDPFVTLFFVVPYRKKILTWCGLNKRSSVGPQSVSTVMS